MRTATITIHPDAITHNVKTLKARTQPKIRLLAMIKANAYGHGVAAVVPALMDADALGVATFAEGLAVLDALNAQQMDKPVLLIEGVFSADEWAAAIGHNFMALIHCHAQADWACQHVAPADCRTRSLWLKYNTGMNRLGFSKDALPSVAERLIEHGYHIVLTSHFACADDASHPANAAQISAFDAMYRQLKARHGTAISASLCNSAGLIHFPHAHYDWVRTGIALYGSSPSTSYTRDDLGLKPAMTLSAKIMATHQLAKGAQVGYGSLWTADKPCRIGIISIGYGDGYPRVVMGAQVAVHTSAGVQRAQIIGRVAMDMIAIDLSALPDADIGTVVSLWGLQPSIDDVAAAAGTIGYELMCRLGTRPDHHIHPLDS